MTTHSTAQDNASAPQFLSISTPPSRPGSSRLNNETPAYPTPPESGMRLPAYLKQERAQIQKHFHDLEWQQRLRISQGYNNPQHSPFRIDRSDIVVNRNRYGNVQPWDNLRVKLKTPIGGSDYINASPISLKSSTATPSTKSTAATSNTGMDSSQSEDDYSSSVSLSEMRYIATQGPKDDQFMHFWTMVMQETVGPVGVVVMLTTCFEGIKEKCAQYFPGSMDDPVMVLDIREVEVVPMEIGDPFISPRAESAGADRLTAESKIEITAGEEATSSGSNTEQAAEAPQDPAKDESGSTPGTVTLLSLNHDPISRSEVRQIRLQIGDQSKIIYHYLFTGWPDYGKPEGEDRRALLELTKQTRERAGYISNPRFVHCSAGVGRTGTFIALDWLLSELEQGHLEIGENQAAFEENRNVTSTTNGGHTWGRSGSRKESTPEGPDNCDLIYDTVNKLREQRMMMVMNEIQYSFLYEVVREAWVEKHARQPVVGVADVDGDVELDKLEAEHVGPVKMPTSEEDNVSEAETEIQGSQEEKVGDEDVDPYAAVAPGGIREEVEGEKGVGAE